MCAICGEDAGVKPSRHRCLKDAPRPESAPTAVRFTCPACRDEFPSRRALLNHEMAHTMAARRAEAGVELPAPDTRQRRRRRAAITVGDCQRQMPARRDIVISPPPVELADETLNGREVSESYIGSVRAQERDPPTLGSTERLTGRETPTRRDARVHPASVESVYETPTRMAVIMADTDDVPAQECHTSPLGSMEGSTEREVPTGSDARMSPPSEEPLNEGPTSWRIETATTTMTQPPMESSRRRSAGRGEPGVSTANVSLTTPTARENDLTVSMGVGRALATPQPTENEQVSEGEVTSLLAVEFGARLQEACGSPITNEGWDSFVLLLGELEAKARDLLKIRRRGSPRNGHSRPPPVDDPKTIQSLYRRNRRKAVRLITGATQVRCELPPREVEAHFREVWRARNWDPSVTSRIRAVQSPVDLCPFTTEEVKARLARFENSAPGEDGIDYKGWRTVDAGAVALTRVFNMCRRYRRVPSHWKESITILLPKTENPDDVTDWRPISLCPTIYKIYAGLITDRLSAWCTGNGVLSPSQKGFTPHDGVFEHNFVLQNRLREARMGAGEVCVAWLDLANAFGSVPHSAVIGTLEAYGAGQHLLDIVSNLQQGARTVIRCGLESTGPVEVECGVKQGCPLSGLLFNVVVNVALEAVQTPETEGHAVLAYADDLTFLADRPELLRERLSVAESLLCGLGLSINPVKCRSLHLSGLAPCGVRPTVFRLGGSEIRCLAEGETSDFLGQPVGFRAVSHRAGIAEMCSKAIGLLRSKLAPWQKLDALKSFVFPAFHFAMRGGRYPKSEWARVDEVLRPELKKVLNLPQEACAEYIYGSPREGLIGMPIAAEESDIALVDGAFKLLTTPDEALARLALAELVEFTRQRIRRRPTALELGGFLSGDAEGAFKYTSCALSSQWTQARSASRRLGVSWSITDEGPSITVGETMLSWSERRGLSRTIREARQRMRGNKLREKPAQGRAACCLQEAPEGSHFIRTGLYTSFADWRFIHKARLGLVALNGHLYGREVPRGCRRCSYETESLAHVLDHCMVHAHLYQRRHNAIVDRMERCAVRRYNIVGKNTSVDGSLLRPDLVISKGTEAIIYDVTVPFENRLDAFTRARERKMGVYAEVRQRLLDRFARVTIAPIVVGSCGAWDRANDRLLLRICSRRYLSTMKRLIISETVSWSRCIYMEHISGRVQRPTTFRPGRPEVPDPRGGGRQAGWLASLFSSPREAEERQELEVEPDSHQPWVDDAWDWLLLAPGHDSSLEGTLEAAGLERTPLYERGNTPSSTH